MSALTRCLQEEANAIASAALRLRSQDVESALQSLETCRAKHAKLVITGVGKSGIVARKIAATFSSIGLTAVFLNPLDALHGDLGIVAFDDVVILLSNSGETTELLSILPHLRRRGTTCIGMVGRIHSSLASGCDVVLDTSVDREVCPLNLAPTASTAVAMAIGDALASVWMERVGISPEDFAINHPAGSLGRQLTLDVSDLMVPVAEIEPLPFSAPLADVIDKLTRGSAKRGSIGAVWLCDMSGQMAGLITDGDLRRALQTRPVEQWAEIKASDLATTNPICVTPEVLAVEALKIMESNLRKPISVLPVMAPDNSKMLIGILCLHDVVQSGLSLK